MNTFIHYKITRRTEDRLCTVKQKCLPRPADDSPVHRPWSEQPAPPFLSSVLPWLWPVAGPRRCAFPTLCARWSTLQQVRSSVDWPQRSAPSVHCGHGSVNVFLHPVARESVHSTVATARRLQLAYNQQCYVRQKTRSSAVAEKPRELHIILKSHT